MRTSGAIAGAAMSAPAGGSGSGGGAGGARGSGAPAATYFRVKPPGFMARRPITGGLPDYTYRKRLWVDTNPATGAVTLRCVDTDIVQIRPSGEIVLTTGGYFTVSPGCRFSEGGRS
jgi:hypothetical protein